MGLNQEFGGREHSPSGSRFSTDLHGKVGTLISIADVGDQVEVKGLKVLGSVWEVAFGQPDGTLPAVDLKIRLSGINDFEDVIRQALGIPQGIPVSAAGAQLKCTLTSEPLDGNEDVLPTVSRSFKAIYLGGMHGLDRKSNEPCEASCKLQLITPATVDP